MGEPSTTRIPLTSDPEFKESNSSSIQSPSTQATVSNKSSAVLDTTLASAANLVKLLPSCTVLVFHTLSPSFTNHGSCYTANKFLTSFLIALCSISCFLFSFTDSFTDGNGKIYYGIATFKGFYVFNNTESEGGGASQNMQSKDLRKFRLRGIDYVHAFFSVVLFLIISFSDSSVQSCFFSDAGGNEKTLLVNLPLGATILSSLVFLVFPTSRKGIGYTDADPRTN